jgi:hypothetical protein
MSQIIDYNLYNKQMNMSMLDKVFFMDRIDSDLFFDFGCADGQLIKFMNSINSYDTYIGYDNNINQIKLARENVQSPNCHFTNSLHDITGQVKHNQNSTLILSSVIHEVLHYSSESEIEEFWDWVFNTGFKYIVIRDMVYISTFDDASMTKGELNNVDLIREFYDSDKLEEFENIWGSIDDDRANYKHFLLKYRYKKNWDREVKENYLSFDMNNFFKNVPSKYVTNHMDIYKLPFICNTIKNDFPGFSFKENYTFFTHGKIILERA